MRIHILICYFPKASLLHTESNVGVRKGVPRLKTLTAKTLTEFRKQGGSEFLPVPKSHETLGTSRNIQPQFLHLWSGDAKGTFLIGLMWGFKVLCGRLLVSGGPLPGAGGALPCSVTQSCVGQEEGASATLGFSFPCRAS